jgi:predicted O-methyltransferase YrrM
VTNAELEQHLRNLTSFPAGIVEAWEKFLERDDAPYGCDIYPEIFQHGILFPLQRMRETEKMIAMARRIEPRVVMEIGSDKGGSFYHWVKAFCPDVAIAIEIRGVPFYFPFLKHFINMDCFFSDRSSYDPETVAIVDKDLAGRQIDVLFIDGDKSAFDKDVEAYLPMVRKGGLIFLHDIQIEPNARRALRICERKGHRIETIVDTSEYDEIEKRERAGLPPASSYEGWFRIWKRTSCGVGVIHV